MTKSLNLCFLLFILLAVHTPLSANQIGCRLADSRIYTTKIDPGLVNALLGVSPIYENNPSIFLEQQCISSTSGVCRVCHGDFGSFLGLITGCPSGFVYGSEVNYITECDLDSYDLTLLLISTGFGVASILNPKRKLTIKHLFILSKQLFPKVVVK